MVSPPYIPGYVFSHDVDEIWVGISIIWAIGGGLIIVFQPFIEARSSIVQVVQNMLYYRLQYVRDRITKDDVEGVIPYSDSVTLGNAHSQLNRTVLVALDGSFNSLRALNHAIQIDDNTSGIKILLLNGIEWANDAEDSIDDEVAAKIEEKGRRMLTSILIKNDIYECERIVKLGDPISKIVEVAERNHAEIIILGGRGLGNSTLSLGFVSSNVVGRTSISVLLINYLEYSKK